MLLSLAGTASSFTPLSSSFPNSHNYSNMDYIVKRNAPSILYSTLEKSTNGISDSSIETASTTSTLSTSQYEVVKDIIDNLPRRNYIEYPTPIEHMPRLSKKFSPFDSSEEGPQLYVKRDDMLPLAGGGSKTRKLDYLIQQALDQ